MEQISFNLFADVPKKIETGLAVSSIGNQITKMTNNKNITMTEEGRLEEEVRTLKCAHCAESIVRNSWEHDHSMIDPTGEHVFCVSCIDYCPTEEDDDVCEICGETPDIADGWAMPNSVCDECFMICEECYETKNPAVFEKTAATLCECAKGK